MKRRQAATGRPARGAPPRPGSGAWLRQLAEIGRDPARLAGLAADDLCLIAFQQCLYYAHTQDPEAAAALAGLYPHLAARVQEPERLELLERVTEAVEEGRSSVVALLPFLQHEPEPRLVALATGAFATLMPLEQEDPLTGPRTLARLAELAGGEAPRVGIAAGLLQLGDARVRPWLDLVWRALAPAGRVALANLPLPGPLVFAAVVEFWLAALADEQAGTRDAAAGALIALGTAAARAGVLEVERKFPANAPDGRDEIAVLRERTRAQQAARIEPDLRSRPAAALAPARAAALLEAWGLAPAAPGAGAVSARDGR